MRHLWSVLELALLLIGPAALPAVAYASPPDPSWLAGIYDDGDADDVVTLVTSAAGDLGPACIGAVQSTPPVVGSVPGLVETPPHRPGRSASRPRAPPAS
jgi:hypothetical protein